jgi:flagellar hook protein FlgE
MSLVTAMNSGATGLEAASTDLSIVGDNIANASTVGFKSSRATFADAMAQSIDAGDTNAGQRGLGTRVQTSQKIMTQGALTNTGVATDMGIDGEGFFVVRKSEGQNAGNYYSRAGQFTMDKDGYLVNLEGLRVQGYAANAQGELNYAALSDLQVGSASTQAQPTETISIRANLKADATVIAAFDPADAAGTSNFSAATTIYDSLGAAHQVTLYFTKTGELPNTWQYNVTTDSAKVTAPLAGGAPDPSVIAQGTLEYDTEGRLVTVSGQTVQFRPIGAVDQDGLTFNFGTPYDAAIPGSGTDGVTQFTTPTSTVSFLSQDGASAGELARISIDPSGTVGGAFTNGTTRVLGQIALATFQASDKLQRLGGNLYQASLESGQPTIGAAGEGGRGSILAGTLEQSNVDLASEFIRMLTAQRTFQANSKTLTTADQLLQELMTIKR